MAEPTDYYARWQRSIALADSPNLPGEARDWRIVIRFYATLYLLEGYMRTKDERFHSERHEKRTWAINNSPEVAGAKASYRALQDLSENVRYDPCFVARDADFTLAESCAKKVESFLRTKLEARLPKPHTTPTP